MSVTSLGNLPRVAALFAAMLAISVGLAYRSHAQDSFFDIFIEAWESGDVNLAPLPDNGPYPFPPPPLPFDQGQIDIELVSLELTSSAPLDITPPDPTRGGPFIVDSFFDISFAIVDKTVLPDPPPVIDSFFDIAYQLQVTPGDIVPTPQGESQTIEIELVSLSLVSADPITVNLPGGSSFDLQIDLTPAGGSHPAALPSGADGHVTVLKLAGGDDFNVDSFFDVYVDLQIDGTPTSTSIPDVPPLRLSSSNTVPIPEPASLVLIALAPVALFALRFRRT